ncbi:uncharacterized protein LAESUDRAFT_308031 [Laetiporus sulphureus 93-53]|uniref:Uncharacterized protein n=1 Tax=Laetiporus sulphureus 93-53 TaxID=1314785 RepID=A0A165D9N3_9APHY|nr:uncharacterized protein LAESUDRAFT_308031 [Laetiporus sulphureus 93-53]KZT04390.1 hypothetical protein LAESUDRAFT_308031 [Laetiporus sulphureus 93-53]
MSDPIERPKAPEPLVRNKQQVKPVENDELVDTAYHTAVWLLQSAEDVDWSELARNHANASQARQTTIPKTVKNMKSSGDAHATPIPTGRYKPSSVLAYLHSDLHLQRQEQTVRSKWREMSDEARHEAATRAFSNTSAKGAEQTMIAKRPILEAASDGAVRWTASSYDEHQEEFSEIKRT